MATIVLDYDNHKEQLPKVLSGQTTGGLGA